jgi:hypothetical protein
MKVALEILGLGPCYHMEELFAHPEHAPLWLAAAAGQLMGWDELFSGYQSTMDEPGSVFYEQLMEAYPDARVILNVRDSESWYESRRSTIYHLTAAESGSAFAMSQDPLARVANTLVWEGLFEGAFRDKQRAIAIFERHNREVKERVQSDRLLVHDVKDGWEPLCRFLEVDVPANISFPRLNTSEDWRMTFGATDAEVYK